MAAGGGFGGGGSGGGGSISPGGILAIVVVVLIVAAISIWRGYRWRKKRDARVLRVRLAAAEASEDDAAFAVETVTSEAAALFEQVQAAWSAEDRKTLHKLCSPDLCVEWERRLDDFASRGWHNKVDVNGTPDVHYVGLVNRADDQDDRVCVLITASLTDYVEDAHGRRIKRNDSTSTTTTLNEYWTLTKRDGRWRLLSIEQLKEGAHNLESELVASPWSDDRLREDAVLEGAAADAAASPADVASLVDLDYAEDGRKAALDLSLVDGRFAPDVLETSARRAVAAWAEAVDGPDAALQQVARPAAIAQLLYPTGDDAVRRVVRGPQGRRDDAGPARRGRPAADHARRAAPVGPALPGEPRHGRARGRLARQRDELDRALDVRAGRRRAGALAGGQRRRRAGQGLSAASSAASGTPDSRWPRMRSSNCTSTRTCRRPDRSPTWPISAWASASVRASTRA